MNQVLKLRIKQNVVIQSVFQAMGFAVDSQNSGSLGAQVWAEGVFEMTSANVVSA